MTPERLAEIKARFTDESEECKDCGQHITDDTVLDLIAEVERLRAENNTLAFEVDRAIKDRNFAESQGARLREALTLITAMAGNPEASEGCRLIMLKARAALEGKDSVT